MDAIILAAGRGERLRPLTDRLPKALVPVGGIPLIHRILARLGAQGIRRVVINICWLGPMIRESVGTGRTFGVEVVYSVEEEALETAGGIRLALRQGLLQSDPFLVHNADVLSDVDLAALEPAPEDDARVVLVPNPPHHPGGDFAWADGRVRLEGEPRLTYAGIGVYRKAFFDPLEPGRFPLRPLLERAARRNRLGAVVHRNRWWDVGTPATLEAVGKHPAWTAGL